jgi:hypothetical protein
MRHVAVVVLILALVVMLLWRSWDAPELQPAAPPPLPVPAAADSTAPPEPAAADSVPVAPPPSATPAGLTPQEIQAVRDAIDNLEFVFRDYAAALDGNPVGTNAEITAALLGDNLKQLKLDLPAGSTLSSAGELCDPWGTPWFFHQLSSRKMEIRSAGKDRRLHTDDDFVR